MKKLILVLSMFLLFGSYVNAATYEDAIVEVADAYYNKNRENHDSFVGDDYFLKSSYTGGTFQYDSKMKKFNISPEDAQIDKIQFTVCSNIVYQIYKETFGISLPYSTEALVSYAKTRSYDGKEYNKAHTNEVHYSSNVYSKDKANSGLAYAKTLTSKYPSKDPNKEQKLGLFRDFAAKYAPEGHLHVGDIVVFRWQKLKSNGEIGEEAGHALMIYSINESTGDVKYIEAYSKNADKKRGISDKPTITSTINPLEDDVFGKTGFYTRTMHFLGKQDPDNGKYLTRIVVIRPMEGKEKTNINTKLSVNNSFLKGKTVTDATRSRLAHPGIVISKTSSAHYGVVMPGERIEYTIKIKNTKDKEVSLPTIIEHYDTAKVKIDADSIRAIKSKLGATRAGANSGKITIEGLKVAAKKTLEIKYYVTVKDADTVLWNTKIESSGSVGNIKNATVVNRVGYKISTSKEKTAFANALNISSSKTGIAYANEVYKEYYKRMGINKTTVLYGGVSGSEVNLYKTKENKNGEKVSFGLLNTDNKFIDKSYSRALGKYSLTDYHSVYEYYGGSKIGNLEGNDWLKLTKEWDKRNLVYPVSANLVDGDLIWVSDRGKTYKEYVFIYYNGKIYSNYKDEKFANGRKIKDEQKSVERFLANLVTFRAYAIFRPLQYYGIETGAVNTSITQGGKTEKSGVQTYEYKEETKNVVLTEFDKTNDKFDETTEDEDYEEESFEFIKDDIVGTYEEDKTETTKVGDDTGIANINKGKVTVVKVDNPKDSSSSDNQPDNNDTNIDNDDDNKSSEDNNLDDNIDSTDNEEISKGNFEVKEKEEKEDKQFAISKTLLIIVIVAIVIFFLINSIREFNIKE